MGRSRHEIEDELRRRIREGVYQPGERLPAHRSLLRELGTSSTTLQAAFDRLVEQGYVGPRTARGTFVATRLPHRSTVALVFPDEPGSRTWNRLYAAILRSADAWSEDETRFRSYHIPGSRPDCEDHRRLGVDIADGGLAGLVFVNSPYYLAGSPVMSSALPRVSLNGDRPGPGEAFEYSLVNVSGVGIGDRILARFRAAGCRRFAGLATLGAEAQLRDAFAPAVEAAGLTTRPAWWLGLPIDRVGATSARAVVALLLDGEPRQRPDCLVIADDNLVPHATAGVLDAGLQVGRDIHVAAHANLPAPTFAAVPCLRYGPDLRALLRTALAELGAAVAGAAPRVTEVPFELEDDARSR